MAEIFISVHACTTGLKRAEKQAVKAAIVAGGGRFDGIFTGETTHLVASALSGPKVKAALAMPTTSIVSTAWVLESAAALKLLAVQDYTVGGSAILAVEPAARSQPRAVLRAAMLGVVMTMTNFQGESRERIKKKIAELGATYVGAFDPSAVSYVVAATTGGRKCEAAVEKGVPVVSEAWLDACVARRTRADVGAFAPPPPASTLAAPPAAAAAAAAHESMATATVPATLRRAPSHYRDHDVEWEKQLAAVKAREVQAASARERAAATLRAREEEAVRVAETPSERELAALRELDEGRAAPGLYLADCRVVLWDVVGERRRVLTQLLCAAGATLHRCYYGEATHIVCVDDASPRAPRAAAVERARAALGATPLHSFGGVGGGGAAGALQGAAIFGSSGATMPASSSSSSYAQRSVSGCYAAGAAVISCCATPALVSTAWVELSVTARRCAAPAAEECTWRAIDDRTEAEAEAEAVAVHEATLAAATAAAAAQAAKPPPALAAAAAAAAATAAAATATATATAALATGIFRDCVFFTHYAEAAATAAECAKYGGCVVDPQHALAFGGSAAAARSELGIAPAARCFEVVPHGSEARGLAALPDAVAVSPHWIMHCARTREFVEPHLGTAPSDASSPSRVAACLFVPLPAVLPIPALGGVSLSISGLTGQSRKVFHLLVKTLGARSTDMFSPSNTHLICTAASSGGSGSERSAKYNKALKWKIPVVTLAWLEACARVGGVVSTAGYTPRPTTASSSSSTSRRHAWSLDAIPPGEQQRRGVAARLPLDSMQIAGGSGGGIGFVELQNIRGAAIHAASNGTGGGTGGGGSAADDDAAAAAAAFDDDGGSQICYTDPESRRGKSGASLLDETAETEETMEQRRGVDILDETVELKEPLLAAAVPAAPVGNERAVRLPSTRRSPKRRAARDSGKRAGSASSAKRQRGLREADSPNVQKRRSSRARRRPT